MLLGRGDQRGESLGIEDCHIRQNLAVEINAGYLETVDQLIVGDAVIASGGADTLNPERAVIALARPGGRDMCIAANG